MGIRCRILLRDWDFVAPVLDTSLLMYIPKNLARLVLVLVMRVFSIDNSRSSPSRKVFIVSRRSTASFLLPQTPISQSSAYLTYL